jgi:hypothetical protein
VGLRHLRPAQRARCACAAVGIAIFVVAGAARSQEPGPPDLGLKGVDEPEAGGEGTNDGQPGEALPKPKTD